MPKITAFGEILWDNLPTGKVLGGAPVNLLTHLAALGADCSVISRCGNDADGAALREAIRRKHVAIDFIQTDPQLATSQVLVQLNDEGCAHYDIVYPCAWDKIQANEAAKSRVAQSDVFIFGSLSVRDAVSRQALAELLPHASFKIFDVNLRPPHYRLADLRDMMRQADFIKLNDDELHGRAYAHAPNLRYAGQARRIVFLRRRTVRPLRLPRNRCRHRGRGRQLFGGLHPPIFAAQTAAGNPSLRLRARFAGGFAARRNTRGFVGRD